MEIIDGQVHLNHLGIEACIAAMDATGVDAAIIDQYPPTGERIAGGALRYRYDVSEEAVRRYPARFAYVARIDPADPEMERLVAEVRTEPGRLGIRIDQPPASDLAAGRYDRFLEIAMERKVPIWIVLPGRMAEIERLAREFPELQLIVDHAGMPENWRRVGAERFAPLDDLIRLSVYPNVAVKWGHMTKMSALPFPYDDVLAHLRRVIDAFGAHRVMWESDWTQSRGHETLAEMLFAIRLAPGFSDEEKEWLLGRSAVTLMRWDRPQDKVDAVLIDAANWRAFQNAMASAGQLPHGGVQAVRLEQGGTLPLGRKISTAELPDVRRVSLQDAVYAMLNGRVPLQAAK